jgi:hypothetical protein
MSRERFQRLLERRWLVLPLSVAVALVSGFLLWGKLQMAYSEYWLEPKLKAADPGLYIYPQLRYTIFDSVFLLWCLDGLIAASLSFWSAVSSRSIAAWAYRTIVIYIVLLAVLILGGSLMLFVRSRGY